MITHQLITLLLLLPLLCTCRTVLCSQQRQQQQQAAASVTTATAARSVHSDVAVRGSNTSDIHLLVERMHAAAFLDNYMHWLYDAHGKDVTLQLICSELQRWESLCAADNSKSALVRLASRLLAALVQERGVSLSTVSTGDSLHIFKQWHRSMKTTSAEAILQLQKVRGTFLFLPLFKLRLVAVVIALLTRHIARTSICLVLCMLVCVDA
jgi:hypothetical protein